jgi:putative membrane protein
LRPSTRIGERGIARLAHDATTSRIPMRISTHRTIRRTLCAAGALTALVACSSMGSMFGMGGMSPAQQAADVNASVRSDADIMGVLHQSNLGEINAGTVAQTRASDQAVRDFAAMMVRDHSSLDRQGGSMAQQWGIAPTMPGNRLNELQEAEMSTLNGAPAGSAFDRTYMASQVMDHERTLAIVDASINTAQRAELKAMLRDQVRPPVAMHLQMAQNIQGRIGTP